PARSPRTQGPARAQGPPRRGRAARPLGDARRPPHDRDGETRALPRAQGANARRFFRGPARALQRAALRRRVRVLRARPGQGGKGPRGRISAGQGQRRPRLFSRRDVFQRGRDGSGGRDAASRPCEGAEALRRARIRGRPRERGRSVGPRAETFLKKAVTLDENAQAYSLLGTIAYERGRLTEATEAFQKAVRLDPDDEDALYQLGLCYLDRGWTQKAAERFQSALELNPNRIEYQEASKLLAPSGARALPKVTGEAAQLARRAEAAAARDPQKGMALYRRALKLDPENPTLLIAHALLCSAVGTTSDAVATTRRGLSRAPGEMVAAAAYTTLLEALKAEGKFRQGSRVAEEMLGAVKSNYARSIAY